MIRPEGIRQRSVVGATALLSTCGHYRYELTRPLAQTETLKPVLFIMLNPSTADALQDDPTIKRCVGFASREGGSQLTVVNLFALRSPSPKDLLTADDPVGPGNDTVLRDAIQCHADHGVIVVAWGSFSNERLQAVAQMLGGRALCLGTTKDGSPRHPLYVRSDQPLVPWEHP